MTAADVRISPHRLLRSWAPFARRREELSPPGAGAALSALALLLTGCGLMVGQSALAMPAGILLGGVLLAVLAGRAPFRPGRALRSGLERRHAALAAALGEGYGAAIAMRDARGALSDLRLVDGNAELSRRLGLSDPPARCRLGQASHLRPEQWLAAAEAVLTTGAPGAIEVRLGRRRMALSLTPCGPEELVLILKDQGDADASQRLQAGLLDELNHRVKNSLTCVSGILRLQARASADPCTSGQLQKAADRVHAIASVHECLYRSGGRERVDMEDYLIHLCGRLAYSLLDDGRVRIEVTAAPTMLQADMAAALGLIVNELVTNAIKHAYPAPSVGVIEVGVASHPDGLTLTVADHGPGLAQSADGAGKGGLGMKLVRSLVAQIGGRMEIRQAQPGLIFEIRAPIAAAQELPDIQSLLL